MKFMDKRKKGKEKGIHVKNSLKTRCKYLRVSDDNYRDGERKTWRQKQKKRSGSKTKRNRKLGEKCEIKLTDTSKNIVRKM